MDQPVDVLEQCVAHILENRSFKNYRHKKRFKSRLKSALKKELHRIQLGNENLSPAQLKDILLENTPMDSLDVSGQEPEISDTTCAQPAYLGLDQPQKEIVDTTGTQPARCESITGPIVGLHLDQHHKTSCTQPARSESMTGPIVGLHPYQHHKEIVDTTGTQPARCESMTGPIVGLHIDQHHKTPCTQPARSESMTGPIVGLHPYQHHKEIVDTTGTQPATCESMTGPIVGLHIDQHHKTPKSRSAVKISTEGNPSRSLWRLEHEKDRLETTVLRKEQTIRKYQNRMKKLQTDNQRLLYRDHVHTHNRLASKFSGRTVKIIENALLSDSFSLPDDELEEIPVNILESDNFQFGGKSFIPGAFFSDFVVEDKDGERVAVRHYNGESSQSLELSMGLASNEYRVLGYLDRHVNIVQTLGISFLKNDCFLIMRYCGTLTLSKYLSEHSSVNAIDLAHILKDVGHALSFLHEKDMIHNSLVCGNILLGIAGCSFTAQVTGFSRACRECKSKALTPRQQLKFKGSYHLPPNILSGSERPSFSSDVYAYGKVMQFVLFKLKVQMHSKAEVCLQDRCHSFVKQCLGMNTEVPLHGNFYSYLVFVFDDIVSGCY